MNKKILSYFISIMVILVCVTPLFVQAQGGSGQPNPGGSGQPPIKIEIQNPFKQNSIQGLIKVIVDDILLPIGGVVAVLMIMFAGFQYVTAQGDPGKIKKAHDALLYAVIGAAILLGAWVISEAIQSTINQLRS
jgi:hypothetical protein